MKSNQIVETPRRHLNPASCLLTKIKTCGRKTEKHGKIQDSKDTKNIYIYAGVCSFFFPLFFVIYVHLTQEERE